MEKLGWIIGSAIVKKHKNFEYMQDEWWQEIQRREQELGGKSLQYNEITNGCVATAFVPKKKPNNESFIA